jgi:hypothetical protein
MADLLPFSSESTVVRHLSRDTIIKVLTPFAADLMFSALRLGERQTVLLLLLRLLQ